MTTGEGSKETPKLWLEKSAKGLGRGDREVHVGYVV